MIFFSIILFLCTVILMTISILFIQFLNQNSETKISTSSTQIKISIIVAAKNEETNIENLLHSLSKLNYPNNSFEVIVVDDESKDSTADIVQNYIKEFSNFKLISSSGKPYPAKKGALSVGIKKSKFDYILTTDADCVVPPNWLSIASRYFEKGSDIIFGLTPYLCEELSEKNNNLVNRISSFERFRGQLLTFLFAKLKSPYSAGGGNFGFKKSAFLKIEGYENTLQTLSGDDDLLINEAVKYQLKITPILNSDFFVKTDSPKTWKEYFKQRARHTATSIYYRKEIQTTLALWHFSNIIILFSPLGLIINWIFIIPIIIKLTIDILITKYLSKSFDYSFNFLSIIPLQIFYELLLIIHFINSFTRKKKW